MRYLILLCLIPTMLISGCSIMVANCGKDLGALNDRDQVRKDFGEPVATGVEEDGREYDDFRSHQKVMHPEVAAGNSIGFGMTLGLSEFYAFPKEVCSAMYATIVGQDIRFYYDHRGKVRGCKVDGDYVSANPNWLREANDKPPELFDSGKPPEFNSAPKIVDSPRN